MADVKRATLAARVDQLEGRVGKLERAAEPKDDVADLFGSAATVAAPLLPDVPLAESRWNARRDRSVGCTVNDRCSHDPCRCRQVYGG